MAVPEEPSSPGAVQVKPTLLEVTVPVARSVIAAGAVASAEAGANAATVWAIRFVEEPMFHVTVVDPGVTTVFVDVPALEEMLETVQRTVLFELVGERVSPMTIPLTTHALLVSVVSEVEIDVAAEAVLPLVAAVPSFQAGAVPYRILQRLHLLQVRARAGLRLLLVV